MKAEHINPFIESTISVFKTMIGVTPQRKSLEMKKSDIATYDISGIIGLSGQAIGSVVISFPESLALKVVSKFMGIQKLQADDDVVDAVGEIVNMIAGGAKKIFTDKGLKFKISIPNVVTGKNHKISRPSTIPCVVIYFTVLNEMFVIEVSLKEV
ncbi:conserved hypothetical protein (plasmid) [Deferribacter desulfuricans SSM1]|uniref:Chemotaxis phosphatase CheX-like domain-containing protein n=1 Tax=Deferribacter desulfuricans (strain DSM 14783 / JCM 11476 / NBRC 101012 / SSM1) TaxID=639282 RepID=D3PEX7_DEFDS|nr:chemotaxis protein CheX [Deferribacter desulfuricans]BAI81769.1 conserved hypothetical protein [Deferribacter desulfuricans SSM1]